MASLSFTRLPWRRLAADFSPAWGSGRVLADQAGVRTMGCRAVLLTGLLGVAACSATPASFGITGPGSAAPESFTTPPLDPDAAVSLPGLPNNSVSPYSNTVQPAGQVARPGNFYGYN
jgi:hypothetical protein